MSYLDPPRFSFYGQFTATPSTVNNYTPNFDPGAVLTNANDSWNPFGWAFFQVPSATVNGASPALGVTITEGDAIIGASLVSVATSSSAPPPPPQQGRLVDLDPDQQTSTMIVGLKLQLSINGVAVFSGTMAPATIVDLWGRVLGGPLTQISFAGSMFQSVLQNVTWPGLGSVSSPFLQALHDASPDTLSIKFNVDAYNGISQAAGFNTGRIVGTIGPYGELAAGVPEPMHVLAQRRMWASGQSVTNKSTTQLAPSPFQVKNGYLTLDLGNSIPTAPTSEGLAGDFIDLGPVSPIVGGDVLAALFSTGAEFGQAYESFAGIYDVDLSGVSADGVVCALQTGPSPASGVTLTPQEAVQAKMGNRVAVTAVAVPMNSAVIALAENAGGQFASLDFNALRMALDAPPWSDAALTGTEITSTAEVPFYATVFGAPAANQTFNVQTSFNQNSSTATPQYVSNAPASAITPPPSGFNPPGPQTPAQNIGSITTDANGVGAFLLTANGLSADELEHATGIWRTGLGSQVYLYTHDWTMLAVPAPLSILMFVNAAVPSQPTWANDVQPIFAEYAKIYPGMKQVLDLSNYDTVVANLEVFRTVMNVPMTDPRHMPVTRDLSPSNLALINAWFNNPLP